VTEKIGFETVSEHIPPSVALIFTFHKGVALPSFFAFEIFAL